jgi:alpha-tubulin suppressor-like RCC1 family protein
VRAIPWCMLLLACGGSGLNDDTGLDTDPPETEDTDDTDSDLPVPVTYASVDCEQDYACALTNTGTVVCFGDEAFGIVDGAPTEEGFTALATGAVAACALDALSEPICWGSDFSDIDKPPAGPFDKIDLGVQHGCALRSGTLSCWGGSLADREIEGLPADGVADVSTNDRSTCVANDDGTLLCVGAQSPNEANLNNLDGLAQVAHSRAFGCGLTSAGSPGCWGLNVYGQLTEMPSGSGLVAITTGEHHVCTLQSTGRVLCWGDNTLDQLEVPDGDFAQISAGGNYTCGVTVEGELSCWGFQPPELP